MGFRMPDPAARRARLEHELDRIVRRLASTDVQRAIPFGSLARGEVGPASDIDLILVRDDPDPVLRRLDRARRELDARVAMDVLVYAPAELEELQRTSAFVRQALREGRILYEAPRSS